MKYYIGIDESGITNNHIQRIYKSKYRIDFSKNEILNFITLILFEKSTFDYLNLLIKELKIKYFQTEYFIFHSYEFFNFKIRYDKNCKIYIYKFLNLLELYHFKTYQIRVDINSLYKKYQEKTIDPYFYGIKIFLDQLILNKLLLNSKFFVETRGNKLDQNLIFLLKRNFKISLNSEITIKNFKFISKKDFEYYLLIEIADLISYLER